MLLLLWNLLRMHWNKLGSNQTVPCNGNSAPSNGCERRS